MLRGMFLLDSPSKDKEIVNEIFSRLVARYEEPHRHYHTLPHINKGLEVYYHLFQTPLEPVKFFSWAYHDSVYDSTRSDNEELSAQLWWKDAHTLGFTTEQADEGVAYIRATDPSATPISVLNDMDLAELGASPEVFDSNTDKIRKEYHWVEPEVWRKGRIAILNQFLKRDKLYLTQPFAEAFETQARENLKRAIAKLAEG